MVKRTHPSTPKIHSALVLVLAAGAVLPVLSGCANARAYSRTPPVEPPAPVAAAPASTSATGTETSTSAAFDNSLLKLEQRAQAAEAERLRKEWEPVEMPTPKPPRKPRLPVASGPRPIAPGSRYTPEEFARLQERQFQNQLTHQQSQDEERRTKEAAQARATAEENAKQEKDRVYFPWKGGWAYTTADARKSVIHSAPGRGRSARPEPAQKSPNE